MVCLRVCAIISLTRHEILCGELALLLYLFWFWAPVDYVLTLHDVVVASANNNS